MGSDIPEIKQPEDAVQDERVIACNTACTSPDCSKGSLAYVMQLDWGSRARIVVKSRSGRWIVKWISITKLANFRFKTLPLESPVRKRYAICSVFTDAELKELSANGAGQGILLRGQLGTN